MKRKLLLALLLPFFWGGLLYGNGELKAQDRMMDYQGEVTLGYSFGLEEDSSNLSLEIVNGIRFCRYFYLGAGIGLSRSFSDEGLVFPLYFDAKGYFPVSRKLDLIMGADIGTKLDYFYETSGGLLLRPLFGLSIAAGKKYAVNIALQYEYYTFGLPAVMQDNLSVNPLGARAKTNHIGLKLGFVF